jgi:hypothetical protein
MATPKIVEDAITLDLLGIFLDELDKRFTTPSDIKTFGLQVSGHTLHIVENGGQASITLPDDNTTYVAMTNTEIDNAVSAALQ